MLPILLGILSLPFFLLSVFFVLVTRGFRNDGDAPAGSLSAGISAAFFSIGTIIMLMGVML